jgi:hypothetical protein
MRDASMEDMAAFWIARAIERAEWASSDQIYRALIRIASQKYLESNNRPYFGPAAVAELEKLLNEILDSLPKSVDAETWPAAADSWTVPTGIFWSKLNAERFEQRYAYYWSTDMWKGDFLTALESQFWTYRDYAHSAGKGKMTFLRELAEVWIAAATTALVRYADDDRRSWRATTKMLRCHADMVEADGLRGLPWGAWGQYSPAEAQSKSVPKTKDQ